MKRIQSLGWSLVILLLILAAAQLGCDRQDGREAEVLGSDASVSAQEGAFCAEHQIAEAQCPFCNPSLIESMGPCPGHGVPEALCYQCNSALIPAFKAVGDWCAPHERPESQCAICNPEVAPANAGGGGAGSAAHAEAGAGAWSPVQAAAGGNVSPAPVTGGGEQAGGSGWDLGAATPSRMHQAPATVCAKVNSIVRLASPAIAQEAGLEFATARVQPVSRWVECNAVLDYNRNLYARLAPQMPGIVAEVHADLGDEVEAGDVLAVITSPDLGVAKSHYLKARAVTKLRRQNHEREAELHASGLSSEKVLLEMETQLAESRIELAEAEQMLLSFGLSADEIDAITRTQDTSPRYLITASFDAVVVERHAVVGEVVGPAKPLFAVADVTQMWAILDVYEADLDEIAKGQTVTLRVASLPERVFGGYISWVSAELDPRTRTLRARAEFDNSTGLLKAHMFAEANVLVRDREPALVVPQAAVQWEGCCNVVFVKQSDAVYQPRAVQLRDAQGGSYQVLAGIAPGDEVVTQGSFLLKTEILRGNLGAGCCEVHPGQ